MSPGTGRKVDRAELSQASGAAERAVTGRDIRVLLGLTAAGLLLAALAGAAHAVHPLVAGAVVAAAAGAAVFPASPAPAAVCMAAIFIVLSGDGGFTAWLVAVASLLHTVHVLAGVAEIIPARARAETAVMLCTARRWLRAEAVTVPLLVVLVAVLT